MSRDGLKLSSASDYLNMEKAINDLRDLFEGANLSRVASNRQVTLNSSAAVEITPSAGVKEMHLYNDTGVGIRYGGSGISTTTGGKLFNNGTLVLRVDSSTSIYMIPESGGAVTLEIVEFT